MQKPFAPAAERNKHAILQALRAELSSQDQVFEIGSGTGQHLCHFAERMPDIVWQPSDVAAQLEGIKQWQHEAQLANLLPPVEFDLRTTALDAIQASVCYSANTLHIISWALVKRLFECAAVILDIDGKLCIYGPMRFNGKHVSDSNYQFDLQLRNADADSGIRDIADLDKIALQAGFDTARIMPLPANNHLLVWQRNGKTN
jgi:hypothetical protein